MYECTVPSGFMVEKTFARRYREYLAECQRYFPQLLNAEGYSRPRTDIPPEQVPKQYRGLQREPLHAWFEILRGSGVAEPTDQEVTAELFLGELERAGRVKEDVILALEDAREVLRRIEPPVEREIVWARCMDARGEPPVGMVLLGYEPSQFFPPLCNSAIADAMFFPSRVFDSKRSSRFQTSYEKLNRWGLFDTEADAEEYLSVYLSALPAEADEHHYDYHITEVRGAD